MGVASKSTTDAKYTILVLGSMMNTFPVLPPVIEYFSLPSAVSVESGSVADRVVAWVTADPIAVFSAKFTFAVPVRIHQLEDITHLYFN